MDSKITFIIPSINRPTLKYALRSLVRQTNPNWECIVVYDGVNGPKFDDNRIRVIRSEKAGSFDHVHGQSGLVRNIGIKEVKTDWIGFLDDDDTINENYVESLFYKYADYDFVVWRMKYTNGLIFPPLELNELLFGKVGISFCYKNKFNNLFFEKNRNGEDFDFLMKLKNISNNYIITPEIYYNVRH